MKLFWWRMGRFAIPTNEFLKYRRLGNSDLCARGRPEVENCAHVAVHCKFLNDIIYMLRSWGFNIPLFSSLDFCLHRLRYLSNASLDIIKIYCTSIFFSWNCKNDVKNGNSTLPISVIAANVLFTATNKNPMLVNSDASLLRESDTSWHPPPPDWIKINVDASLLDSNLASIGGVVRDSKGRLLLAFGKHKLHWDINQLELDAIFSLKEFIKDSMFESKGLIIKEDNNNAIKFLHDSMTKSKVNNQIFEKISFLRDFNPSKQYESLSARAPGAFPHISRNCNKVDDLCATLALDNNFCFDSFTSHDIPSSLSNLLKKEYEICTS
ncbi:hypothetical protein KFK09_008668 [Dendrobium nobile]|uniref:RNase H type-1 domain-containing protein n=1 Tax=Dendrobium nobile TaxID=94219 RepID=A0A8T3BLS2_DENNO|nr:hypothetical protein KFK09_008668 [Dendrobium nobile]